MVWPHFFVLHPQGTCAVVNAASWTRWGTSCFNPDESPSSFSENTNPNSGSITDRRNGYLLIAKLAPKPCLSQAAPGQWTNAARIPCKKTSLLETQVWLKSYPVVLEAFTFSFSWSGLHCVLMASPACLVLLLFSLTRIFPLIKFLLI